MKKFKDIYKTLKVRDIIYSDAGENYLDISIVVEITEETIRFKTIITTHDMEKILYSHWKYKFDLYWELLERTK